MSRRLIPGLAALRLTGGAALLLLIWNPVCSGFGRRSAGSQVVLLDASLSMAGSGGRWREALDTARALAAGAGGVIWRFGARVRAFDSGPPSDGASALGPPLALAAERGGPIAVVTDGAVDDVARVAPDLVDRARIVVLARPPFRDAFVASVVGPHHVAATDTMRLMVSCGTAGRREAGSGMRDALLTVTSEGRRLASRPVTLPDSGVISTELTLPASRIPHPGWSALEVRLDGIRDSEPRDDARLFVVEVNPAPSVVVLATPPDWDLTFLARTLADVARVPVRTFVAPEPGAARQGRWRDAVTLARVAPAEVARAVRGARLVVQGGDPATFAPLPETAAILRWPTQGARALAGDWYVDAPPASQLALGLAGPSWDSLPPAVSLAPLTTPGDAIVALTARLARQGPAQPVVVLSDAGGRRRADLAAAGLYRWAFRGGASAEAYRALVAALADWLLGGERGQGNGERAVPIEQTVANGLPLEWRWTGAGAARNLSITLTSGSVVRRDTLRFDAAGRSEITLLPGVYRYAFEGGGERGMIAVETYSDEWRPRAPALHAQRGAVAASHGAVSMRELGWLYALVIAVFAAEWAWRRRTGLP